LGTDTSTTPETDARAAWSPATRFAFRFCFIYFLLYLLPRPFMGDPLPRFPLVNRPLYNSWRTLLSLVSEHALGWSSADGNFNLHNAGDAPTDYVRVLCCATIAVCAAIIWSLLLRRSPRDHHRLHALLRFYLRVVLGIAMLGYGLVKVFGTQFAGSPIRLFRPLGQMEPMQLLWNFMWASGQYQFITGIVEVIGGLLLFFRRTTLLGTLVVIGSMANVVALNLSYDVGVKLWSIHLLLIAVFLLAPDATRLAAVLFAPRANALNLWPLNPRRRQVLRVAKTLLILWVFVAFARRRAEVHGQWFPDQAPAAHGVYEVVSFTRNGTSIPPVVTDTSRWRRVVIDRTGDFAVQMMDDSIRSFRARHDDGNQVIELQAGETKTRMRFRFVEVSSGLDVSLERGPEDERIDMHLRRIPDTEFPLLTRKFRWTR
jgi:hypothetical protein